ncbi:unnamed protein product, partial [marine sediment metagenome]
MCLANKIRHLSIICLVPLIIVMPGAVSAKAAEQARAKLEGTVLNINKEAISEAELQLKHEGSGQKFYFKSNEKGEFSSPPIPAGNYNLTVEKEGYKSYTGELKLRSNIVQKINLTLVKEMTLEQEREEEAIAYFKKGTELSGENKIEEAIQAFQKAVELKED